MCSDVMVVVLRYYPMVELDLANCDQPSSAVMEASELSSVITKTGSVGDIEVIYINNTYQISSSK